MNLKSMAQIKMIKIIMEKLNMVRINMNEIIMAKPTMVKLLTMSKMNQV